MRWCDAKGVRCGWCWAARWVRCSAGCEGVWVTRSGEGRGGVGCGGFCDGAPVCLFGRQAMAWRVRAADGGGNACLASFAPVIPVVPAPSGIRAFGGGAP
eukprot:277240-Chlamydomonas_euryale.AAC.2